MTIQLPVHFLSFSKKLFYSVVILFLTFTICFIVYQYKREKEYKIELLNTQLQNYNDRLNEYITTIDTLDFNRINNYVNHNNFKNLRVNVISSKGKVLYDNTEKDLSLFNNHLSRKEIQEAILKGSGYAINRPSETFKQDYFYVAGYYKNKQYILRSALPYTIDLITHLKADSHFLWFALIVSIVLIIIFYRFTNKLGISLSKLQNFALRADKNQWIDTDIQETFHDNELGEISQHIIRIYKRLHKTKEDLLIEREKLMSHLQISREGLGVFKPSKMEILVNNQFTQYINLISDHNPENSEDIFTIPEFVPINKFINKALESDSVKTEKRMSMKINKTGRVFLVECIIFQDKSFEISINDISDEDEKARIKKQLTQNIAHELKTPVSSIQGYLETIINNPDLPKEKIFEFLNRSFAQSNRLTHLLRDISVLTRMEEAPEMIESEVIDISKMVKNIINEVALELEKKCVKVVNNLPESLTINGNYSLIYSIFRNLLDNAIAYAGVNITVTIKNFREDNNLYYFSFSDNGVGVSQEHLNRLFERFYRVDKGRSRKMGGTGLGLAIVKNAVILHGGTIFAKETQGGGLEFIFTFSK